MRICRVLSRPNQGGPTRQAAALHAAHGALGATTLLVAGRCPPQEVPQSLTGLGVRALGWDEAVAAAGAVDGWVELPELGPGQGWRALRRARRRLGELLAAVRPDVVHSHTSHAGLVARLAARDVGVPVVAHTFHGHVLRDYFGPLRSRGLALLERWLARRTDLLCAVSPSCADELAGLGVAPRPRIAVVPPAVPLQTAAPAARLAARRRLGVGDDAWLAVCAGRLVPIKRIDRFAQMVALVPGLRGHVHGGGPLAEALRALRVAQVELLGPAADLPALLPGYDVAVLPSRREGCPLFALECFAAGVPVVGHDVPGVRDALGPWGGGLLVPEAEGAAGLAAAVQRLRREPGLAQACVAAGRAGIDRFAPDAVAARLLDLYRAAVRDRQGRRP